MSTSKTIGWDACAGRTTILAQFPDPDMPLSCVKAQAATEWDLWMAGYIRKERVEEFINENESNTGRVRAEALRDLLDEEPEDGEGDGPLDTSAQALDPA